VIAARPRRLAHHRRRPGGNRPIREITTTRRRGKDRLERISGVGAVEIVGGREREIRVWLSADRLSAYGVAVDDVTRALQTENLEIPGGRIEMPATELVVRTRGRIQRPSDFADIIVAQRASGPIYVRDLGTVEDGMMDERSVSRLNGDRAVSLLIRRQSGTNAVEVAAAAKAALAEITRGLPQGFTDHRQRRSKIEHFGLGSPPT
jgi:HAE1 family hydrophobic/amphiphilic exporter-1